MTREEIREELRIIVDIVGDSLLGDAEFEDHTAIREALGMDSLQITELLFEIEERLGAKISDEEARDLSTIGDLITLIEAKTAGDPTSS